MSHTPCNQIWSPCTVSYWLSRIVRKTTYMGVVTGQAHPAVDQHVFQINYYNLHCTYLRTYVRLTYLYTRSRDALVGFMFIYSNAYLLT